MQQTLTYDHNIQAEVSDTLRRLVELYERPASDESFIINQPSKSPDKHHRSAFNMEMLHKLGVLDEVLELWLSKIDETSPLHERHHHHHHHHHSKSWWSRLVHCFGHGHGHSHGHSHDAVEPTPQKSPIM